MKSLISINDFNKEEMLHVLDLATKYEAEPNCPIFTDKVIACIFFEPSTRTRLSFETAASRLGARVIGFASLAATSIAKGESLKDTARTIDAMGADLVVLRHPMAGAAELLGRTINAAVINAGDGAHEHPTQALLDLYTVKEKKGRLKGLKVAIIGDILHSRVARSNIWGFTRMGAEVRLAGPATLMAPGIERTGAEVCRSPEEALEGADVVMVLRIQLERQQEGLFPGLREYARLFGINRERLTLAARDALVMHPGPMNRGIEIAPDVADGLQSVVNEQVTNGVAVRMALLYLLIGGGVSSEAAN